MRPPFRRTRVALLLAALASSLGGAHASALTLADLVAGEPFAHDGVVYDNFRVKVLGSGLSHDLSRYEVVPGACGFQIAGNDAGSGGDGKLRIRYDVSATEEDGIVLTSVSVFSGESTDTMVKNKRRVFEGKKLVGTLFAKPMPGMDYLELELDGLGAFKVVDTIRVWGRFADGANVTSGYYTPACLVPEPGTALLLAAGLLGLSIRRPRDP